MSMRISIPRATTTRPLKYQVARSPKLTITSSNDLVHLQLTYTPHEIKLIIYRNLLRLSKYYSHIGSIRKTYKEYVKMRSAQDYIERMKSYGFSTSTMVGTEDKLVLKLFNSLIFVNNACCNGVDNREYTVLKHLLSCFYKSRSEQIGRSKRMEFRGDGEALLEKSVLSMNETLDLML